MFTDYSEETDLWQFTDGIQAMGLGNYEGDEGDGGKGGDGEKGGDGGKEGDRDLPNLADR